MEYGEGGDLQADGVTPCAGRFHTATFRFQVLYDLDVPHFDAVSRRFPALAIVLAYSDPNWGDHGSYLLCGGRRRSWRMPVRQSERILRQHKRKAGITDDDDPNLYQVENEAYIEMTDVAERHWESAAIQWLTRAHPAVESAPASKKAPTQGARKRRRAR